MKKLFSFLFVSLCVYACRDEKPSDPQPQGGERPEALVSLGLGVYNTYAGIIREHLKQPYDARSFAKVGFLLRQEGISQDHIHKVNDYIGANMGKLEDTTGEDLMRYIEG